MYIFFLKHEKKLNRKQNKKIGRLKNRFKMIMKMKIDNEKRLDVGVKSKHVQ